MADDTSPLRVIPVDDQTPRPLGRLRWWICALLFFATTINYMDRQVVGVLKPTLQKELHWNEIDYSNVIFWFQVAYAAGYLFAGRMMDLLGVRLGYGLVVALWSAAAMAHAAARSVFGFGVARFGLGLAEGGNFPAAVKTVSEWFPKRERAFATGIFNAGTNVGAIVTPLVVPWITLKFGWPAAFLWIGSLGFIWSILWWCVYRDPSKHSRLSTEELAYIQSDPIESVIPPKWIELLAYRGTWAFVTGMVLTGPIWWFYLYWIPGFLFKKYNLDLTTMGLPLMVIYLVSDAGSVLGGWGSSRLIRQGWNVAAARKVTMLICALCVLPVFFASQVTNVWSAVALIGLAAAAHQAWAANLYTLVSDSVPKSGVSSVVGIGGMAGAIAGMFFAKLVGYVLEWTASYLVLFAIASLAYVVAWGIIALLIRENTPVEHVHPGDAEHEEDVED